MGSIVNAKCHCGSDQEIMVGAGMMNSNKNCYFPCYCEHCNEVIEADIMSNPDKCPICESNGLINYTDSKLSLNNGSRRVASWRYRDQELQLDDGHYMCPS